jgi:chromosome segregation ATPase
MYPQPREITINASPSDHAEITPNLLGPLSATTIEFYEALLNACNQIGTPWVMESNPQKKKLLEKILTQIRIASNTATSVLETYEKVRRLSEFLPTTFLWYVSSSSPKGRIQSVLKQFPKEILWLAALQDSRQDTHDCREELRVLRDKQEKQAKMLKEMESYQQQIKDLHAENQELKSQLQYLENDLLEVETELDEVTEEKNQLQEKLHELEQKALIEQRVLTPSEVKMLELITKVYKLENENAILKKMKASSDFLSKSAPSSTSDSQGFFNRRSQRNNASSKAYPSEAKKTEYKTPAAHFS